MSTKTTQSTVRVALSHNYSTFEATMQLENPDGITPEEIKDAVNQCQVIASGAVADYKQAMKGTLLNANKEVERIGKDVKNLKTAINNELDLKIEQAAGNVDGNQAAEIRKTFGKENIEPEVDPEEIAKVEAMPMYEPKPKSEGVFVDPFSKPVIKKAASLSKQLKKVAKDKPGTPAKAKRAYNKKK